MSGGPNIAAEDGSAVNTLEFRASRDIAAGEEIYIDYGTNYDRSEYR
jgi:SET domain-containing protein